MSRVVERVGERGWRVVEAVGETVRLHSNYRFAYGPTTAPGAGCSRLGRRVGEKTSPPLPFVNRLNSPNGGECVK